LKAPGPTNQKSVPGLSQRAETLPPGATCSASSPLAMAPLAWITTPPGAGTVATGWLAGVGDGELDGDGVLLCAVLPRVALPEAARWCAAAWAARTPVTVRAPGWVMLASGAAVFAPIRLTTARPAPVVPGPAMSAT
jgi:hypothetical protein